MIFTIGDSFTYGEELLDRENQAWPYLLAKKLDTTVINLGECGGSADRCFRLVINDISKNKYELVIVAWPFPNRLEAWSNISNSAMSTQHDHRDPRLPWVNEWYKFSYDKDFMFEKWFCQILALQSFLKQMSQDYLFLSVAGLQGDCISYKNKLSHIWDNIDKTNYIGWPQEGMIEFQGDCPIGTGGHPLELGHQRIADKIYDFYNRR